MVEEVCSCDCSGAGSGAGTDLFPREETWYPPPPIPGAAQSNLLVVPWELGWVGVCRGLTDSAPAFTCVGRTWQDWQGALAPDTEVGFVLSSRAPGSLSPAGMSRGGWLNALLPGG